jgi:serine/threonine-protein kinase
MMVGMGTTPPGRGDGRDVGVAATMSMGFTTATVRELQAGDDVGGYRIDHVIGEGGMGTVYGAVHPLIGKRAAIKVLRKELCASAEAVERFVQEARAVNQIGHPNIVDCFAFGALPDGRSWCAMEWLTGESLSDRMARRALSWDETRAIAGDVIRALDAAHGKGIVHRDLKPDNVFLVEVADERPRVKLLDFGIAKLTGGADQRASKTRTGAVVGTPLYIAPEQARGLSVEARTDVYSLGVMLFEMIAGRPPFDEDNAADLIAKHLTETPPLLRAHAPNAPAEVEALIAEMLEKRPEGRPSLAKVRAVLANANANANAKAPSPAPSPEDAPLELAVDVRASRVAAAAPAARSKLPFVIGAIAIAAAGAIAFALTRGGASASKHPAIASGTATPVEPDHPAPPPPPTTPAGATLDVTLTGAPRATISIDGDEHDVWKGAPAMIPVAAGHHEVTVTSSGFRTFHTSIDAAAGARIAVLARMEKQR